MISERLVFQAPQSVVDADLAERMSAMKRPGESDMDFYERRYQERVNHLQFFVKYRRAIDPLHLQLSGCTHILGPNFLKVLP